MADCVLLVVLILVDGDVSINVLCVSVSKVRRCVAIALTNVDVIVGTGA